MVIMDQKRNGAYYTPPDVVESLVRWAVRHPSDRLLDPSCGDGRFLALHRASAGVEQDPTATHQAMSRAPWAKIHEGEFFTWARQTDERFDCAAGNPPFIRYQRFTGDARANALGLCARLGARFSSLTSSWAPFLVATASLLRRGGRLAFVVPAEIGHAPYATPLLQYLLGHFAHVQVIAIRDKVFRDLSEDCWLLYADGFGGTAAEFKFTVFDRFRGSKTPPRKGDIVSESEWKLWNRRLRPFLTSSECRSLYQRFTSDPTTVRMGDVARVGIGYVTGANDFFHLCPSGAKKRDIPSRFLQPTVRSGKSLTASAVTHATVKRWMQRDDPVLLLRLKKDGSVPASVQRYLDTPEAAEAQKSYKCRNRDPWYAVPDVTVPDGFLSYMSGSGVSFVANHAGCACTNSVHAVHLTGRLPMSEMKRRWSDPITALSCELEGHPLGGGMLKVEPGEALRLALVDRQPSESDNATIHAGLRDLKRWRHHG